MCNYQDIGILYFNPLCLMASRKDRGAAFRGAAFTGVLSLTSAVFEFRSSWINFDLICSSSKLLIG